MRCIVISIVISALLTSNLFSRNGEPSLLAEKEAAKGNWSTWRGPNRDGLSAETGLLSSWQEHEPKLTWKIKGLGDGFSSVAVSEGRIYTMGQRDGVTKMIALSTKAGTKIWEVDVDSEANDGPNSTPSVDEDRVYGLTHAGQLVCINTTSGSILWKKHFLTDFKGKMESGWGYSESPIIDGGNLICTPGGNSAVMVALNKKTGEHLWSAEMPTAIGDRGHDGAGYSSIVIGQITGRKQYVQLTGRGVIGVDSESGDLLWTYNRIANGVANIPTPIVKGDYIFCSTGYGTGAALIQIHDRNGKCEVEEKYFLKGNELQNHHGGMVLVADYIYCGNGHNQGYPICLNMMSGEYAWGPVRGPGTGSAAILYADGHLYFRYESGDMALIEATPGEYKLKGTFKTDEINGKSWPHPVIADKKLYLRDQGTLMVYNIANAK
jgi:outer membrane protein assembly factor BamB